MSEPVSASYRVSTCCGGRDCEHDVWDTIPDGPCWGQVGIVDPFGESDFIHTCQGHECMDDYSGGYVAEPTS